MKLKRKLLLYTALLITGILILAAGTPAFCGEVWSGIKWWPVKTSNWYLPEGQTYSAKGKVVGRIAPMLLGPKEEEYVKLEKAKKPWKIGVLIPHLKDPYWVTANWALADEAKRLGINLWFKSAGGYTEVNTQLQQLEALHTMGMDGMVLASVHSSALCKVVKELASKGAKIVTAGIDSQCNDIVSNVIAPYIANGRRLAEWLDKQTKGQKEVKVAWFPGPSGPSWPIDSLTGFKEYMKEIGRLDTQVKIVAVKWGDSGKNIQLNLIENVLQARPDIDYIIGLAPAADAAVQALAERGLEGKIKILASYVTQPVHAQIKAGKVADASIEHQVELFRIALNQIVKVIEGATPGKDIPFQIATPLGDLTPENVDQSVYEQLFGPKDWQPVFRVKP